MVFNKTCLHTHTHTNKNLCLEENKKKKKKKKKKFIFIFCVYCRFGTIHDPLPKHMDTSSIDSIFHNYND